MKQVIVSWIARTIGQVLRAIELMCGSRAGTATSCIATKPIRLFIVSQYFVTASISVIL